MKYTHNVEKNPKLYIENYTNMPFLDKLIYGGWGGWYLGHNTSWGVFLSIIFHITR